MKVVEFLVDGFEQIEAMAPIDLLRRAEIEVDIVSVFNVSNVKSSHNVTIETEKNINDEVVETNINSIIYGEYINYNKWLLNISKESFGFICTGFEVRARSFGCFELDW